MLPHAADAGGSGTSGVAFVLAVAGALILALVLAEIVAAALRAVGRRLWLPAFLARRTRMPVRTLLAVVGVWVGVGLVGDRLPGWFEQAAALATIAAAAWLVAVVLPACTDAALSRHRMDAPGRRHARGSRALAGVIRRVVVGLVPLAAVTAALLVLDGTRVAGLVSAGALVLAQLALTDAVRLDDVIAVDGEWGRVEEITATSVLLQVGDDRRVVVPSRRLTRAAFENWTRRTADLVGTVDLDIDPGISVVQVRAELVRLVEGNDLWDRRVAVLQVADATGGRVRVRAVVSAVDAPRLMDLRCDVREALVEWLRVQVPSRGPGWALPIGRGNTVGLLGGTPGAEAPDRTVRGGPATRRTALHGQRLRGGAVAGLHRSGRGRARRTGRRRGAGAVTGSGGLPLDERNYRGRVTPVISASRVSRLSCSATSDACGFAWRATNRLR